MKLKKQLKTFAPLAAIFGIVILLSSIHQFMYGANLSTFMRHFMGWFFIIFGGIKIFNFKSFAHGFAQYDLLAQKTMLYAYAYPFIELALGGAYLFNLQPLLANVITIVLLTTNALGVLKAVRNGKHIQCACLGNVIPLPLTYVTLFEDLLMVAMALFMLLKLYF